MDSEDHPHLHFLLIPLMAQGHTIPMIDMARLFAARGVVVTIVTTPITATKLSARIDRMVQSGLQIRLLQLPFPCQEVGLPEGCESLDALTSTDMVKNFFIGIEKLQKPVEHFLQESQSTPNCIISDMGISWASETAAKLGIPRLVFHGTCCFSLLCFHNIRSHNVHESVAAQSDSVPFVLPGLPHRIEITKAQLPEAFKTSTELKDVRDKIRDAELKTIGVVVNSFYELEPEYYENFQMATGRKAWTIGPVSLCNKSTLDKTDRGDFTSDNQSHCLNWLDSRKPKSVVYVCFGSLCRFALSQMIEIGLGLEASNQSFIWVIRNVDSSSSKIEKWLSEGFEQRVKEKGLIIRGWAPQVLILSHPATGGFLTHCGWNSTLESICAGVPMITWPLSSEQFLNEKLVVNVLDIAVPVGAKASARWWEEGNTTEIVRMDDVKMAIERLMGEGEEGEERRKKAKELGEKATRSMEENGSSYNSMTLLIEHIKQQACKS